MVGHTCNPSTEVRVVEQAECLLYETILSYMVSSNLSKVVSIFLRERVKMREGRQVKVAHEVELKSRGAINTGASWT